MEKGYNRLECDFFKIRLTNLDLWQRISWIMQRITATFFSKLLSMVKWENPFYWKKGLGRQTCYLYIFYIACGVFRMIHSFFYDNVKSLWYWYQLTKDSLNIPY